MADLDGTSGTEDTKEYHFGIPQKTEGPFLKGCGNLDWGMKNRLSRVFNPQSGKTVMLAFDHGYFQGPTTGLERVDVSILPLEPYCDTLMVTRGMVATLGRAKTLGERSLGHPDPGAISMALLLRGLAA